MLWLMLDAQGAALSGRAKGRHQLSTLLTEAYQNREALEEKIAMGRRNRKEAGNKYGVCYPYYVVFNSFIIVLRFLKCYYSFITP